MTVNGSDGVCPVCGQPWDAVSAKEAASRIGVPYRTLARWLAEDPPIGARRVPGPGGWRWALEPDAIATLQARARDR